MSNKYCFISLTILFLYSFLCVANEQELLKAAGRGDRCALCQNIEYAPTARASGGATALHVALEHDQVRIAQYLIRHAPSLIDVQTADGDSPVYIAIKRELYELAYMLIRSGADVNLGAQHGRAPVHIAVLKGHMPTIEALLCAQVRLDVPFFRNGETVLHLAASEGHCDVLRLLLLHGCDTEGEDTLGRTALHRACEQGHLSAVQFLMQAGADMHAEPRVSTATYGKKLIEKAISYGKNPVIKFLLEVWVMGAWQHVENMDAVYVYKGGRQLPVFFTDSEIVEGFKNKVLGCAVQSLKEKVDAFDLDRALPADLEKLLISFVAAQEDLDAVLRYAKQNNQEKTVQFLRSIKI